jgi:metal-responsive CopG/Arc/MetJ family transcriptional regulator
MDRLMKSSGCKNRSRLIGLAIDSLGREYEPLESLTGNQTAVITVISGEKSFDLHKVSHSHPGMVKLNAHLDSRKGCIEILAVEGDGQRIRELFLQLRNSKEVRSATLSVT